MFESAHTTRLINVVTNVFVTVTSIWNFVTAAAAASVVVVDVVVGYGYFLRGVRVKTLGQSINLTCFM